MTTLTLNLSDKESAAITAMSQDLDLTKTALLKQALRLYQHVHRNAKDGRELAFVDKDGAIVRQVVVGIGAAD